MEQPEIAEQPVRRRRTAKSAAEAADVETTAPVPAVSALTAPVPAVSVPAVSVPVASVPASVTASVPVPALDETDPGSSELPSRVATVVGARSGEPLFSPEEAARFRAAAADVAPARPGAPISTPMIPPVGAPTPMVTPTGPGAGAASVGPAAGPPGGAPMGPDRLAAGPMGPGGPIGPAGLVDRQPMGPMDRPPMDRIGPPERPGMRANNVYRARRPGVAILLTLPALGVAALFGRGLAIAAFGKVFLFSGVLASCLALTAVPLMVLGLYGLVTGAAFGADHLGFRTWARPPLAYLLVGMVLLVASGLAVR